MPKSLKLTAITDMTNVAVPSIEVQVNNALDNCDDIFVVCVNVFGNCTPGKDISCIVLFLRHSKFCRFSVDFSQFLFACSRIWRICRLEI